ncbi:unnamed protein product [Diamesa tonsa]
MKFVSILIVILGLYLVKDVNAKPNPVYQIERLRNLKETDLAEELSGQFQGDIIISEEQLQEAADNVKSGSKTGLRDSKYRWKNNIVPYHINESYFDANQIEYIHSAVQRIMDVSCLKFVARNDTHEDFITVVGEPDGCYSYVGRQGGRQFLNLAPNVRESGCFRLYTIVHEFTHALGFFHMQSATERDEYVEIVYDKIQQGMEHNFNIYGAAMINNFGVEYDYGSMMHYGKTAFSVDGSDTIVPLKPLNGQVMGQRLRMSENDIERINMMYCNDDVPSTTTSVPTTISTTQRPVEPSTTTSQPETPPPSNPGGQIIRVVVDFVTNLVRNIFGGLRRQ